MTVAKDDKWGFINQQGETIIPLKYEDARSFYQNLARVKKEGKWGFINKRGEVVIPLEYDKVTEIYEGLVKVEEFSESLTLSNTLYNNRY